MKNKITGKTFITWVINIISDRLEMLKRNNLKTHYKI